MFGFINNPILQLGNPLLNGDNAAMTSVQQWITVMGAAAILYGHFADPRIAQWGAIAIGANLVVGAVRGAPVVR